MSDFGMRRRMLGQTVLTRRRMLQATASAGLTIGLTQSNLLRSVRAQDITFTRDYEGTTLNLLMEDLLETTIIEEMLPEFTDVVRTARSLSSRPPGCSAAASASALSSGPICSKGGCTKLVPCFATASSGHDQDGADEWSG